MTELATGVRQAGEPPPPSPRARRTAVPGWRDTRLVAGVLVVLLSVVLGARLVAAADRTEEWISARRALPAGHVLGPGDLTTVRAHLATATGRRYYPGRVRGGIVGARLAGAVGAGDLIGSADLVRGPAQPTRLVPLVARAGHAPALTAGDRVDVYVLATTPAAGAGAAATERQVLHDVEFTGGEDLASGDRSLTLRVPVASAIDAVAASQSDRVDVVRIEPGADGGSGGAGPPSAPAYGTSS